METEKEREMNMGKKCMGLLQKGCSKLHIISSELRQSNVYIMYEDNHRQLKSLVLAYCQRQILLLVTEIIDLCIKTIYLSKQKTKVYWESYAYLIYLIDHEIHSH